jgi:hypothetical protein
MPIHCGAENTIIVGAGSGKGLDAVAHGTANGTAPAIWTCTGGANRKWSRQ